ncbi:MAG: Ig-like domain-containing protein [Bacteroidales bacterium]|nr:Ig-like domain-containing protein [Bacteroidales bacterium]
MQHLRKLPALFLLTVIWMGCAHPVSPGGGPKDMKPPQVLESKPENGSALFAGNKFSIEFDEFISLENIAEEGLISPPLNKQPDFKIKGKTLQVKFKEPLKPNTTYTVYFGDAIVDITEKNPLRNFTYIFSTGEQVDSLSLQGEVIDAFNLEPVEDVFVLLYKNNNDSLPFDSLPLAVRPYYLSKTDENGKFGFFGLADESYLLFALTDLNRNYFFDQPGEAIAFLDSLALPQYFKILTTDTTSSDSSAAMEPDSSFAGGDSLVSQDLPTEQYTNYTLYLFHHKDTVQKLLKAELVRRNTLRFAFSLPATDIRFEVLNFDLDSSSYKTEFTKEKDTVIWFLKELPVDTLKLLIWNKGDSLELSTIRLKPQKKLKGRKKKDDALKKQYLGWTSNVTQRNLVLDQQAEIIFDQPVASSYTDSAMLVTPEDTIYNPAFVFLDSLHRKIQVPFRLEEESKYSIFFPDSSFTDWNGLHSPEIRLDIITKSLRDYGIFTISLHPAEKQAYLIQLLGKKEAVVRQHRFQNDTTIVYNYLLPGKYLLKLIFDDNNNGKWDTGDYLKKRQAEKLIYFMKEINVRANWEIEEDWGF